MEAQRECDMAHDAGKLINMISHQMKRQSCFPEKESGLTNMQRLVLHYILFQAPLGDIYQKDIEKAFQIRRSSATGILQLLEKNGFIYPETVEWDARLKKLLPTQKALELKEQIIAHIQYMEALLRRGIPEADLKICLQVLEELGLDIPVCGMVKDDNHRTRGLYFHNVEIPIDRHGEGFKLITRIQDEAHRFAIEYHRSLRSKTQVHSILDDIEGIGPARRKALMRWRNWQKPTA